jgi:hypothetical protein
MAGLAHHFGIRPWEIERLSYADFTSLCAALDAIGKE